MCQNVKTIAISIKKMIFSRSVSPYIPRTLDCKLNSHIYEMILYEFLKLDAKVKKNQHPSFIIDNRYFSRVF